MGTLTVKEVQAIVRKGESGRYGDGEGLYLMLPPKGSPYWMIRYTINGKRKALTLGKQTDLSLAEARSEADAARKKVRSGNDPVAERKLNRPAAITTVNELFTDWLIELQKRLKNPQIPARVFKKDISPQIGLLAIDKVTPLDVRAVIRKISDSGRPSISNDALLYMKQLFNHAIKLGLTMNNPAAAFRVNDAGGVEKSRERALTLEEIGFVFEKFKENSDSFSRDNYIACALLILLGVRKTELTESKWTEYRLEDSKWVLPADRSKTGREIAIPLSPLALTFFNELKVRACGSEYVFPNRRVSKTPHMGKDTLNRALAKLFGQEPGKKIQPPNKMKNLEYFTVHDLRRTCRSLLASLSVPPHIAERCLNHKIEGVQGIYDRYDYYEERKKALNRMDKMLERIFV
ncbi:integrase arm-type DNA-binding domain-containing protein [Erwiniaceae bacterium BAC15a-03b]|uniref:Integrase arm-type DNA-binding domain-containing protein n=1 Tax=Winslowiella arboricola TaxID=2978220 RepID=A0A9J6PLM4_9GAMM|nr:site-specific integrase [Winslowiella arboricola]MCU5773512.1 integrase arm-type DNA-binding domain-containing protein [Winslowiella arboricola]MCU5776576.1 integrase arm-type DNA-binding domain-containing protein [Winslowiella arboricola]